MAQLPQKRERPLEGLRIIDLGTAVAGPYGPLFLADFGAEVIKVEDPGQGDMLRLTPPFYNEVSMCWAEGGRNKKSITVDLRKPEGQRIIKDLVRVSDAIVENYRPGTLEKWNLGYEELKKINPEIILVRVSGFGQSGPYRLQAGFDTVGLAMGGFTYLTGAPQGPPMRPGFVVGDYMTALFNALATMIAIYHRDIRGTGEGQWSDVSLYETIFRITEYTVAAYHKLGLVRERTGNTHPSAAPMDHFQTKDGKWIAILVSRDNIFARFARAISREELRDDPRFSSSLKRAENANAINEITREWVGSHTLQEAMERLWECAVPAGPIYSIKDIFEDPHYQARENIAELEDPILGKVKMPAAVPKFSLTPGSIEWTGPPLGHHNEEILMGLLGYSQQELLRLAQADVIKYQPGAGGGKKYLSQERVIVRANPGGGNRLSDNSPLAGLRVLDIGTAIAGPFGATLLADFGAEVIKVEDPAGGDNLRKLLPRYHDASLFWVSEGRNKKTVTLDLRKEKGQEVLKDLVRISDVVIENYRPGTLEKWNLGYEELRKVNQSIILVRVSGFGQYGPYKDQTGLDSIGAAMGGITYMTGDPEGPPMRPGLAICDYMTGTINALATLIALYYRDGKKTGQGQVIDLALYESIFRFSEYNAIAYDKLGIIRKRTGNAHPSAAPLNHFPTRDGKWVVIICANDNTFNRLAKAMGQEYLIADPRFSNMANRAANAGAIHDLVKEWTKRLSLAEILEILRGAGVPVGAIYSIKDIFEDPHYHDRGNIIEVEDPVIGPVKMPAVTPRFSLTPGRVKFSGPKLGQFNEEVYGGLLTYSQERLELLRQERII